MDKQQVISFIKSQLSSGKISKSDLLNIEGGSESSSKPYDINLENNKSAHNLTNVFYVIGAVIAVIGVVILISQHWDDIGATGRVGVTLGIGLVAYIAALLMGKSEQRIISQAMFTISVFLSPMGIYILLNEAKVTIDINTSIMISIGFAIVYGFALLISRRNVLSVFTTAFITWTYYSFLTKLFDGLYMFENNIFQWATMILGIAYILVAYGYSSLVEKSEGADKNEKTAIKNLFYTAGTVAVLGSGISIGGSFDLIFIAIIFAAFYASVYVKNTSMLILAGMFLIAHIFKLTSRYFIDSIGWPVALILSGFLVIGIGYITYYLNKKYIKNS